MTVPGSNLLAQALRAIKPVQIQYFKFQGRTLNASKQWMPTYAAGVPIWASVQAVPRNTYAQYGLDFQRDYIKIFAQEDVVDLDRDSSGDQFIYNYDLFQLESENRWFLQDGWASCLAVKVTSDVPYPVAPGASPKKRKS
jgi:hypothetical protein